jgi:hypothetical protein
MTRYTVDEHNWECAPHSLSSPPVHPTSWGSQPQHSGGGVSPIPLGRHRHSTHHPPHEQLLVRLEVGGVLFVGAAVMVVVVGVLSSWQLLIAAAHCPGRRHRRSSPPRAVSPDCHVALALAVCPHVGVAPHHRHCSTHNPPHEQLLVRLGAGGVSCRRRGAELVVLVAWQHWWSSSHVACTPIAPPIPPHEQRLMTVVGGCCHCPHEAGGGWWVVLASWRCPTLL